MKVKACNISTERELQVVLDEMYSLAKQGNEPFYNLIELMCNEQTIMTAIHNIKSNKGSKTSGIDGKTISDYLNKPYEELIHEIKSNILNYKPKPVKRRYIPKGNSDKLRPLGIPAILDRIIQEITRVVLNPIAEAKFYKHSFGYRPMRSAEQAMAEIQYKLTKNKTYWVIEGDIKGFFDNMNHNKLITMLWNIGIKDKRVLSIIKKMLKSGIVEEDGKLYPSELGSPQGGIISPLLSNIYLNQLDWMIAKKWSEHPLSYQYQRGKFKSHGFAKLRKRHNDFFIIRYADDWVVLCKTEEQAKSTLSKIKKYLKHCLSLELSLDKTHITNVLERRAKFLGYEFWVEPSRKTNKLVGKYIPNIQKTNHKIREINKEIRRLNSVMRKSERDRPYQIEKINMMIVGLAEYYSTANCSNFFKKWDNRIRYQQHRTFQRLNGNKGRWKKLTMKANQLNNRVTRHEKRNDRLYYINIDNVNIGITKFSFTPSRNPTRLNEALTPYTEVGRKLYEKKTETKLPLLRNGTTYNYNSLTQRLYINFRNLKRIYNYEYIMNREYAYLRDKGKCKCCNNVLNESQGWECHHINNKLKLNLINKVSNLVSLCFRCHKLIHSTDHAYNHVAENVAKKIERYKSKLAS